MAAVGADAYIRPRVDVGIDPYKTKRRNKMKKICIAIGLVVSAIAVLLMSRKKKEEYL